MQRYHEKLIEVGNMHIKIALNNLVIVPNALIKLISLLDMFYTSSGFSNFSLTKINYESRTNHIIIH